MALSFAAGKLIPVWLVVLAICALSSASKAPERRERRVSGEDSTSQRLLDSQSSEYPDSKSSNFRNNEFVTSPRKKVSQRRMGGHIRVDTRTEAPIASRREEIKDDDDDNGDDEATWDDGLILASAGNGKEKNSVRQEDDDEKKTLSQQVKEGKYGLIQNEIYPSKPQRPGIISYLSNPEVPKDNAKNLGGLDEDEIWLAENHVLVLRGGNFPDHVADAQNGGERQEWPPIDDYRAPKRQVKIPPRPKVPPPFPVQLSENGPVEIIGVNGTTNTGVDGADSRFDKGFLPGEGPFFAASQNASNAALDLTSQENSTKKLGDDRGSGAQDRRTKSGHVPPPPPPPSGSIGPFYPALPPGAVFVVPPGNLSEYDEDDQSIYYPPPYSFYYKQDNSTPVPPGPLVPGIILPPPPDFFAGQEERKPTTKMHHTKYTKRPSTTPMPRITPTYYPPRKSSAKIHKATEATSTATTTKQTSRGTFTMKPVNRIKYKSTTVRTTSKPIRVQEIASPFAKLTTTTTTMPATSQASSLEISDFYTARPNTLANQATEKTVARTRSRWSQNVSTRPVPLVTYYRSSTPSSVDEPVEATPASVNNIVTTGRQRATPNQASYYFYKEDSDDVVTTTPEPTIYYRATTEASPYYELEDVREQNDEPKKDYYDDRVQPTQQTPKGFSVEVIEPVTKTSARYQYANSRPTNSASSSRAQGQRMLADPAPVYYDSVTQRPREPLRPYYTTTRPRSFLRESQDGNRYDYDQGLTPKPIYQYSYEAADYFKRGQQQQQQQPQQQQPQRQYYKPESQQQSYYKQDIELTTSRPEAFDEWQDIREESNGNQQYDYESGETLPEQQIQPEREAHRYENPLPVAYPSSTVRPIIDTTPNPQHAYYTKQDEQLLDDVTREYFTNFGKKLRGESLPGTTPIYGKTGSVTERPDYQEVEAYDSNDYGNERETATFQPPRVRVHYGDHHQQQQKQQQQQQQQQRPYSLQDDIEVNYKDPLPPVDPDSEWIPGFNPKQRVNVPLQSYRNQQTELQNQGYVQQNLADQRLTPIRGYDAGRRIVQQPQNGPATNFVPLGDSREEGRQDYPARPVSLAGDIAVNYRNPRPPINPDAEFIDPGAIRDNGDKASYFAYRLPGDGGHFYFLTPQAISQRQDENGGYLYPRPRGPRLSRRRRRGPGSA